MGRDLRIGRVEIAGVSGVDGKVRVGFEMGFKDWWSGEWLGRLGIGRVGIVGLKFKGRKSGDGWVEI